MDLPDERQVDGELELGSQEPARIELAGERIEAARLVIEDEQRAAVRFIDAIDDSPDEQLLRSRFVGNPQGIPGSRISERLLEMAWKSSASSLRFEQRAQIAQHLVPADGPQGAPADMLTEGEVVHLLCRHFAKGGELVGRSPERKPPLLGEARGDTRKAGSARHSSEARASTSAVVRQSRSWGTGESGRKQARSSSAERPSALITSSTNGERSVSRPRSSRRGQRSAMLESAEHRARWKTGASSASCVGRPSDSRPPGTVRKTVRRTRRLMARRSSSARSGSTGGAAGSSPSTRPATTTWSNLRPGRSRNAQTWTAPPRAPPLGSVAAASEADSACAHSARDRSRSFSPSKSAARAISVQASSSADSAA